jgi:hypothetical protein
VFGGFLFRLGLRREFTEVLHHGIRINLADGADFAFKFTFARALKFAFAFEFTFKLALALTEETANDIAKGAEPAFAFHLTLEFAFEFEFGFGLTFKFTFELGFQFVLRLVCHVASS